jgi:glycosyltransferase involved in cell wall biosynthesis
MDLVSIVVTTKNSGRTIEACLRSIKAQTYAPVELIVVDNGSSDETPVISARYADRVMQVGPERCAQRNAGIRASRGTCVCILDSDMILREDVVEKAIACISPSCEAIAIPEESFGTGFWSACKAAERALYVDDRLTAGARLFTRRVLDDVGLYDESLLGGEDWDLSIRATKGGTLAFAQTMIYHDEGRLTLAGLCRKKFYYGASIRDFIRKHGNEALRRLTPLRPSLLQGLPKLLRNPVIGLGCVFMKACEFAALACGMLVNRRPPPESVYRASSVSRGE